MNISRVIATLRRAANYAIVGGCLIAASGFTANAYAQKFEPAERWSAAYGYNSGWRLDRHIRTLANVGGTIHDDIVGFGNDGVYVSLSQTRDGVGSFTEPSQWLNDFGYEQGWDLRRHPRFVQDMNGDGRPDIVGFWEDGVYVALNVDGEKFAPRRLWLAGFAPLAGGWDPSRHPRQLADWNLDGKVDVVGFGEDGIYVALNLGGSFGTPARVHPGFGYLDGWRMGHKRVIVPCAQRKPCVFGFHDRSAFRDSPFDLRPPIPEDYHRVDWAYTGAGYYKKSEWFGQDDDLYPVYVAQVEPPTRSSSGGFDYRPSLVGFGPSGVFVHEHRRNSATPPVRWVRGFGKDQGWSNTQHIRLITNVIFGGRGADVIGFGHDGVYLSRNEGNRFSAPDRVLEDFGVKQGWYATSHPRYMADVGGASGHGPVDIVGFGKDGVWVSKGYRPVR